MSCEPPEKRTKREAANKNSFPNPQQASQQEIFEYLDELKCCSTHLPSLCDYILDLSFYRPSVIQNLSACPLFQDSNLGTILYRSLVNEEDEFLRLCVELKLDLNNLSLVPNYATVRSGVLHAAILKGDPDTVEMLLAAGADVNFRDSDGYAPASHVIDTIVGGHGGIINWKGDVTDFPFMQKIRTAFKILDILLDYGANINFRGRRHDSLYHWAVHHEHWFVQRCASHSADLPADLPEDMDWCEIIIGLVHRGANPFFQNTDKLHALEIFKHRMSSSFKETSDSFPQNKRDRYHEHVNNIYKTLWFALIGATIPKDSEKFINAFKSKAISKEQRKKWWIDLNSVPVIAADNPDFSPLLVYITRRYVEARKWKRLTTCIEYLIGFCKRNGLRMQFHYSQPQNQRIRHIPGRTAIHYAVSADNIALVRTILECSKADINDKNCVNTPSVSRDRQSMDLFDEKQQHLQLSNKWNLSRTIAQFEYGGTPLLYFAVVNCTKHIAEMIRLLINYGADVNQTNSFGTTPLHHAVYMANEQAVDQLLACPLIAPSLHAPTTSSGNTVMHCAVYNLVKKKYKKKMPPEESIFRKLLRKGGRLCSPKNIDGYRPCDMAVTELSLKLIEKLLRERYKSLQEITDRTLFDHEKDELKELQNARIHDLVVFNKMRQHCAENMKPNIKQAERNSIDLRKKWVTEEKNDIIHTRRFQQIKWKEIHKLKEQQIRDQKRDQKRSWNWDQIDEDLQLDDYSDSEDEMAASPTSSVKSDSLQPTIDSLDQLKPPKVEVPSYLSKMELRTTTKDDLLGPSQLDQLPANDTYMNDVDDSDTDPISESGENYPKKREMDDCDGSDTSEIDVDGSDTDPISERGENYPKNREMNDCETIDMEIDDPPAAPYDEEDGEEDDETEDEKEEDEEYQDEFEFENPISEIKKHRKNIENCSLFSNNVIKDDISNGHDPIPTPVYSSDIGKSIPPFSYITHNIAFSKDDKKLLDSGKSCCDCVETCWFNPNCKCFNCYKDMNGLIRDQQWQPVDWEGLFEYQSTEQLDSSIRLISFCSRSCTCSMRCSNRHLPQYKYGIELFYNDHNGWRIRAGDLIPAFSFIAEYLGEYRVKGTIARRIRECYVTNVLEKYGPLEIDARTYGNVSRFLSHSCTPNAYCVMAWQECTPGSPRYRILIYSNCFIEKGTEITINYNFAHNPNTWEKGKSCVCQI